jgi:hypothetical protein
LADLKRKGELETTKSSPPTRARVSPECPHEALHEQLPMGRPGELVVKGPALELRFKGCVRPTRGLCYSLRGKEVEASKPIPNMGLLLGGWSQWRNRLPHEE